MRTVITERNKIMFNQQPVGQVNGIRSTLNWWGFLAQVGAVSVEVFLHKRIGKRYCRLQAFMVLPLGLFSAWLWELQGYDVGPFLCFLVVYVGAVAIAQLAGIIQSRRGEHVHTQYNGWPMLLREENGPRELAIKQFAEPMIVFAIGMLIYGANKPLGVWLIFAAACLFVSNSLNRLAQKHRVDDMRDAVFAQQQTAGEFRGS